MRIQLSKLCCMALLPILAVNTSHSQDLTLPASQDTWLNGTNPTSVLGTKEAIRVVSNGPRIGLVQFDSSTLDLQEVESAGLQAPVVEVSRGGLVSVHIVRSAWAEDSVSMSTAPTYDATPIAFLSVSGADAGTTVGANIGIAVQQWASNPNSNFGLALLTSDANVSFGAIDGGNPMSIVAAMATHSTRIDACTVISAPGPYTVVQNIQVTSGQDMTCLNVVSDNVSIDLGGFVITGTGSSFGGTAIGGSATRNVKIQNGTITDFYSGVDLGNTENVSLDKVVLFNIYGGASIGPGSSVKSSQFTQAASDGPALTTGAGSIVKYNIFMLNNIAANIGYGSLVINNVVKDSNEDGMNVGPKSNVIGNLVIDTWDEGLEVGSLSNVVNNTAHGRGEDEALIVQCPSNVVGNSIGSARLSDADTCNVANNLIIEE